MAVGKATSKKYMFICIVTDRKEKVKWKKNTYF